MYNILLIITIFTISINAQDPAEGWMGYATTHDPINPVNRITYIEAKWVVPADPKVDGAFFSPWFGIESTDNLNLIQPVGPFLYDHWEIYNEYFQWSPLSNKNSVSHKVLPGDILFASITFNPSAQSYEMYHSNLNDTWNITTEIPVQKHADGSYKNFTIAYFAMEKSEWLCEQYPPDGKVLFYDIVIEFDNRAVSEKWTTSFVEDHCNCRAHVLPGGTSIAITWDTSSQTVI